MQWSDIPRHPTRRLLQQFGALLAAISGGVALWRGVEGGQWQVLAVVSAVSAAVSLVRPQALRLVFVGWLILAFPVGWVVGRAALALVYFGLFTPVGLVLRVMGRDPLRLARSRETTTYWTGRPPRDPGSYFRQY